MMKKKKNILRFGCCPNTHTKFYEITLIIGFSLSLVLLTLNMYLTLWCFKMSYYLLSLEIIPIAFNGINILLFIILRCWRSDGSILKKNFSTSICISCFILVLIIINLLSSIVEEFFYYCAYKMSESNGNDKSKFAEDIFEIIITAFICIQCIIIYI